MSQRQRFKAGKLGPGVRRLSMQCALSPQGHCSTRRLLSGRMFDGVGTVTMSSFGSSARNGSPTRDLVVVAPTEVHGSSSAACPHAKNGSGARAHPSQPESSVEGGIPLAPRFWVLRRDNFRCHYCGTPSTDAQLQVEHVRDVALGGSNDPDNLVAGYSACNAGKGVQPAVSE